MSPWLFVILGAYIILSWLERITAFWLRRTKEFDRMFDIFTFVKKSRQGVLTPWKRLQKVLDIWRRHWYQSFSVHTMVWSIFVVNELCFKHYLNLKDILDHPALLWWSSKILAATALLKVIDLEDGRNSSSSIGSGSPFLSISIPPFYQVSRFPLMSVNV